MGRSHLKKFAFLTQIIEVPLLIGGYCQPLQQPGLWPIRTWSQEEATPVERIRRSRTSFITEWRVGCLLLTWYSTGWGDSRQALAGNKGNEVLVITSPHSPAATHTRITPSIFPHPNKTTTRNYTPSPCSNVSLRRALVTISCKCCTSQLRFV